MGDAIFDESPTKSKTCVAHRHLKLALGTVDLDNCVDMPSGVAKYSGLDVLCHSIESLKMTQICHPTYSPNRQDFWFFENYVAAGYPSIIEIIPVQ